ncbi:2-amino-4-hydroxy-6-hydroxymethyldihydropteridine diphosphokinase [Lacibacter sp. H407]|uniref:2-amino-4-hydroxy-6- hydroxymethyldihydropteridine diphosphokinase n=1 Tax=Lacibacter sp. H407 TaxID=3133423 RepID=UPI0030C341E0
MPLHHVFILLGSNQGQRKQFLQKAMQQIQLYCGSIVNESSIYETAAWGNTKQASFLNKVISIRTKLPPDDLMKKLLEIELNLGRVRIEKYGPRTIDLDILFYDALIYHSAIVTLPHPAIQDRKFVLIPLAELSPGKIHPVYKKTINTLLKECADQLAVIKH